MNGKNKNLGTFDTEEEAAAIYAKATFLLSNKSGNSKSGEN
jgi:hypothetical protein